MPYHRLNALALLAVVTGHAGAQTYTVRTLNNQIPPGDLVLSAAAARTPAGVEIVGIREFHDGGFDRTPLIFATATSNAQLMNNPPSDSTRPPAVPLATRSCR